MRRNIDLTDNMMFSSPIMDVRGINLRLLEKNFGRKFHLWNPNDWSNGEAKDSIIDRQKQLFPLGDKEERDFIRECIEMDSMDFCDCCGASLVVHPWARNFGLCSKCTRQLEDNYGNHRKNLPWYYLPDREQRSRRLF